MNLQYIANGVLKLIDVFTLQSRTLDNTIANRSENLHYNREQGTKINIDFYITIANRILSSHHLFHPNRG